MGGWTVAQGATAVRESLYVGGYLGVMPVLRDTFAAQPAFRQLPDGSATVAAGVSAGLLAAVASQPADTIKTRMQVRNQYCEGLLVSAALQQSPQSKIEDMEFILRFGRAPCSIAMESLDSLYTFPLSARTKRPTSLSSELQAFLDPKAVPEYATLRSTAAHVMQV